MVFIQKWLKLRFYLVNHCGVLIVDSLIEELKGHNIPKLLYPWEGYPGPANNTIVVGSKSCRLNLVMYCCMICSSVFFFFFFDKGSSLSCDGHFLHHQFFDGLVFFLFDKGSSFSCVIDVL